MSYVIVVPTHQGIRELIQERVSPTHFYFHSEKTGKETLQVLDYLAASQNTPKAQMLQRLEFILRSDDYDDEFEAPDTSSVATARQLIERTGALVGSNFPLGHVYANGTGGVGIQWDRNGAVLSLSIPYPASEQPSLYYQWGDSAFGTEKAITPDKLSSFLNQLNRHGR